MAAAWDLARHPHGVVQPFHVWRPFFSCEITGVDLQTRPETSEVAFVAEHELPAELVRSPSPSSRSPQFLIRTPAIVSGGDARLWHHLNRAIHAKDTGSFVHHDDLRLAAAPGIVRLHSIIRFSTRLSHRLPNDYPTVLWGRRPEQGVELHARRIVIVC